MTRPGDYRDEMRTRRLLDREIERLLAGVHVGDRDLALLTPLVEGLRSTVGYQPGESEVRSFAARAAAVVLDRPQPVADTDASHRYRRGAGLTPRLAVTALALVVVPATAGAALAADSAIPGEPLYGLDRAFESVGIGSGSAGERLDEAVQMAADGRIDEALEHAVVALQTHDGEGTDVLAGQTLETISAAAADPSGVAALLAYISENVGKGVGADGREFGQGVAELAREIGGGEHDGDFPAGPATGPEGPPAAVPDGTPAVPPETGRAKARATAKARETAKARATAKAWATATATRAARTGMEIPVHRPRRPSQRSPLPGPTPPPLTPGAKSRRMATRATTKGPEKSPHPSRLRGDRRTPRPIPAAGSPPSVTTGSRPEGSR
jgi:hypothetical protein